MTKLKYFSEFIIFQNVPYTSFFLSFFFSPFSSFSYLSTSLSLSPITYCPLLCIVYEGADLVSHNLCLSGCIPGTLVHVAHLSLRSREQAIGATVPIRPRFIYLTGLPRWHRIPPCKILLVTVGTWLSESSSCYASMQTRVWIRREGGGDLHDRSPGSLPSIGGTELAQQPAFLNKQASCGAQNLHLLLREGRQQREMQREEEG